MKIHRYYEHWAPDFRYASVRPICRRHINRATHDLRANCEIPIAVEIANAFFDLIQDSVNGKVCEDCAYLAEQGDVD